jgi:hypothetical protein
LITKSILFENNDYLFAGNGLPQLKIYDTKTLKSVWTEKYETGKGLLGADITSDSKFLFVSYYDATLALYKLNGPTSVENQINNSSSVDIYPNPASDYIEISIPDIDNQTLKGVVENGVQIFNTLGIEVAQTPPSVIYNSISNDEKTTQTGASELLKIDISHLPAGVYFIKIGDKVEKFVKI